MLLSRVFPFSQLTSMWYLLKSKSKVKMAQSCPTLCDPVDCSPQSSSVHGILQARILEWLAIPFSSRSSQPRNQTWISCMQADSLPSEPPGKLYFYFFAIIVIKHYVIKTYLWAGTYLKSFPFLSPSKPSLCLQFLSLSFSQHLAHHTLIYCQCFL